MQRLEIKITVCYVKGFFFGNFPPKHRGTTNERKVLWKHLVQIDGYLKFLEAKNIEENVVGIILLNRICRN